MRKILFIILIILLLVGAGITIANGLELGNFQIWGVKSIISENESIDKKNNELSNLVSVTYPATLNELDTSSETLASTKKEYEENVKLISNSKYYMQTEKYEIEFLWTKLGNYAKDNNVQIKIDVVNSSTSGLYDLNFSIAGEYVNVTEFIYDVENDSKLGFKIEDFHMSAVDGGVQGNFSCKEIGINIETAGEDSSVSDESTSMDEDTTNTTDTSNSTSQNTTNTIEQTTNEVSKDTTNDVENQAKTEAQ